MKERLNILFPGSFKPLHGGHIMMAQSAYDMMSEEYDVHIYYIIGGKERDSFSSTPTIELMRQIFANIPYIDVIVSESYSPVHQAYVMTEKKEFGNGYYCLLSSTKERDIKRSRDFFRAFDKFGKYHTEGVKPILLENVSIPLEFTNRTDEFQYTPISSSVLRMDIMNDDFENFFDGYRLLIECKWMDKDMLDKYYNDLKASINASVKESILYNKLNESGLGGHIPHLYEINDMKFTELFNIITDLFAGKIEDITEKVDGMNLFASVDLNGNVIFARNKYHMEQFPFTAKSIKQNKMWGKSESVSEAFYKGACDIEKVFNLIPDTVNFFNITDLNGNLKYRKWVNIEVVDPDNVNVISYSERMIMIHSIKLVEYKNPDGIFFTEYSREKEQSDKVIIGDAINRMEDKAVKIGFSPKVLINAYEKGANDASEICSEISELISEYNVSQLDTIGDFKIAAAISYLSSQSDFKHLSYDIINDLAHRLIFNDGSYIQRFKTEVDTETFEKICDFRRSKLTEFKRKINAPLENILSKAGNKLIKQANSIINKDRQDFIRKDIKTRIINIIDKFEKTENEENKDKLEQLLIKLNSLDNVINATEGIIFEYKGSLVKITGSYGIINRIINLDHKTS